MGGQLLLKPSSSPTPSHDWQTPSLLTWGWALRDCLLFCQEITEGQVDIRGFTYLCSPSAQARTRLRQTLSE